MGKLPLMAAEELLENHRELSVGLRNQGSNPGVGQKQ